MATFLGRPDARDYLKEYHGIVLGTTALVNLAYDGRGPRYAVINGRAVYKREWLDAWVAKEAARPVLRAQRKAGKSNAAHA